MGIIVGHFKLAVILRSVVLVIYMTHGELLNTSSDPAVACGPSPPSGGRRRLDPLELKLRRTLPCTLRPGVELRERREGPLFAVDISFGDAGKLSITFGDVGKLSIIFTAGAMGVSLPLLKSAPRSSWVDCGELGRTAVMLQNQVLMAFLWGKIDIRGTFEMQG